MFPVSLGTGHHGRVSRGRCRHVVSTGMEVYPTALTGGVALVGCVFGRAEGTRGLPWPLKRGARISLQTLSSMVISVKYAKIQHTTYVYVVGLVLALGEASEVGRARGSEHILQDDVRESFHFPISLSLNLRGTRVVSTAAAARIASFAGCLMPLMVLTSYDQRG